MSPGSRRDGSRRGSSRRAARGISAPPARRAARGLRETLPCTPPRSATPQSRPASRSFPSVYSPQLYRRPSATHPWDSRNLSWRGIGGRGSQPREPSPGLCDDLLDDPGSLLPVSLEHSQALPGEEGGVITVVGGLGCLVDVASCGPLQRPGKGLRSCTEVLLDEAVAQPPGWPSGEDPGYDSVHLRGREQASPVRGVRAALAGEQEPGAHLDARRTESQGGDEPAAVHDPTRCDYRNLHRVHDLRDQRQCPDERRLAVGSELDSGAVPPGLRALG